MLVAVVLVRFASWKGSKVGDITERTLGGGGVVLRRTRMHRVAAGHGGRGLCGSSRGCACVKRHSRGPQRLTKAQWSPPLSARSRASLAQRRAYESHGAHADVTQEREARWGSSGRPACARAVLLTGCARSRRRTVTALPPPSTYASAFDSPPSSSHSSARLHRAPSGTPNSNLFPFIRTYSATMQRHLRRALQSLASPRTHLVCRRRFHGGTLSAPPRPPPTVTNTIAKRSSRAARHPKCYCPRLSPQRSPPQFTYVSSTFYPARARRAAGRRHTAAAANATYHAHVSASLWHTSPTSSPRARSPAPPVSNVFMENMTPQMCAH